MPRWLFQILDVINGDIYYVYNFPNLYPKVKFTIEHIFLNTILRTLVKTQNGQIIRYVTRIYRQSIIPLFHKLLLQKLLKKIPYTQACWIWTTDPHKNSDKSG